MKNANSGLSRESFNSNGEPLSREKIQDRGDMALLGYAENKNSERLSGPEIKRYEKALSDEISANTMFYVEGQMDLVLANLTWRGLGGSPRERYDSYDKDFKAHVDRYRLFYEAKTIFGYDPKRDEENIPQSMFLRYLADRIEESPNRHLPDVTIPLTESELEHHRKTAGYSIKHLSGNKKDISLGHYLMDLTMMCRSVFGENSRAEMYLHNDLNQMLSPDKDPAGNNKSKIIDRLIERKLDAAQKIATGKTIAPSSGIVLIGFTGALDLPEGIENRSVKEMIEEGVPGLYGYSNKN